MTLNEWLNTYRVSGADFDVFKKLGVDPLNTSMFRPTATGGGDEQGVGYELLPEYAKLLEGYNATPGVDTADTAKWNVSGPAGADAGQVTAPIDKESWFDKFAYAGGPIAMMVGAGLFGPGGLMASEGASAVTPEMIGAANATADPIAALNAASGWTGVDHAYLASIAGNAAPSSVQEALNDLTRTSSPAVSSPSSVQGALNDLVQQSQLPAAYFASPGVNAALGDLVGMSIPTSAQAAAAAAEVAKLAGSTGGAAVGGGLLDPIKNAAKPIVDVFKDNKELLPIAGALLGGAGGGSSSGGGYNYTGPMPTISRGGWSPAAPTSQYMQAQPRGLLNIPTTGNANSGLWRYLQGG
jgi:hypothetical protein